MTALHHIHEAGLLYNLGQRARLDDQKPYTFMVSYLKPYLLIVCHDSNFSGALGEEAGECGGENIAGTWPKGGHGFCLGMAFMVDITLFEYQHRDSDL